MTAGTACPPIDDVVALVERTLDPAAAEAVATHVEACAHCHAIVLALAREWPGAGSATDRTGDAGPPRVTQVLATGEPIGRHTVERMIGAGAMGLVYACWDAQLARRVAVKLLRPDASVPAEVQQARLLREAQAMARLANPHVIGVYEAGAHRGQVYLAMEYIDGGTLAAWLAAAPRSWRDIVRAFLAAGDGLRAAHSAGLIHRDFKPENVLVRGDGRFCVADFGLARVGERPGDVMGERDTDRPIGDRLTRSGAIVGTPRYMAPEQARGETSDGRADQFSYCVALYEALYAAPPFHGATIAERLAAIEAGPAAPPHTGVPRYVERAIRRGMAADPRARFPTMDALLAALAPRRAGRVRFAAAAGAAIAVAGIAAAARTHEPHEPREPQAVVRSVRRLTFAPGCEGMPSFAPDGNTLVYHHEAPDGDTQLYALVPASGAVRPLTQPPGFNHLAAVSPDGRRVAYVHDGDRPSELRVLSLAGGAAPRTIAPLPMGGKATWLSPSVVALFAASGDVAAIDIDDPAAHPQPIALPHERAIFTMSAFGDGALALDWNEDEDRLGLGVLSHGRLRVLAEHQAFLDGGVLAAPSQRAVYFAAREGAIDQLIRVPRGGGEPQVVGGGIQPSFGVAITGDGRQLVFSTCRRKAQLVRVDGDDALVPVMPDGDWDDNTPVSVDDQRLAFSSNRTGSQQLFVLDARRAQVTAVGPAGGGELGGVSQDRQRFAYTAYGAPGIWIGRLDGSAPARRLTDDASDAAAVFSHDDRQVIFERGSGDDVHLWIVAATGGPARPLVAAPSYAAMTSAADDRVFFVDRSPAGKRLMVIHDRGGTPEPARPALLARSAGNTWGFIRSRDGRRILVVRAGYEILELEVDSDRPPVVKHRLKRWIVALDYAGDDRHVIAAVNRADGDLWLAEGEFP